MSNTESEILLFDAEIKEQRDYWIKRLSEKVEASNFALDYQRLKDRERVRERLAVKVDGELYAKLRGLTGQLPFLTYTALMAALKICLHRYTGREMIVVGSPALKEVKRVAQKQNALAIVDEVDPGMSFRQLLLNVRETLLEAYSKQRYPFQRLVRDLGINGSERRCPLFDVALVLTDIHDEMPEVDNDLTLAFTNKPDELDGYIEFDSNLFSPESIERLRGHFVNILGSALENTGKPIAALGMLTEAERRQILTDWNLTQADYPREKCFQQLFEAQAQKTPDAVAAIFGETQITYQELNRQANQLAHRLRKLNVRTESPVGICMEPSLEMIVSLLAALKAGAAYVPLSPTYPSERLGFILKDARIEVLLTQQSLDVAWPEHDAQLVYLDTDRENIGVESADDPQCIAAPENLAYILYTSGSTGQPKGSMISHTSLVNYLYWINRHLMADDARTLPAITKLSFDASLKQLLAPLLRGDYVWMLPEETGAQPVRLLRALSQKSETGLNCVPSLWKAILAEASPEDLARADGKFTSLMLGGEALTADLLEQTFNALPRLRVWNLYGPTEATANASAASIDDPAQVSIGRPIANAELYLLDKNLEPVPVGVAGEMFIGGTGLTRGYLRQPELTAERFLPHPFADQPGARLYRTGDIGRYLSDGRIEYLGRLDDQVKVRGYRIELGEIEAALLRHEGVRECVVVAREEEGGDKRLVAYVVADAQARPTGNELRSRIKESLPEYMLPGAFVMLDALPLMHNGKVDKRALPAPHQSQAEFEDGFVAPRTPMEEMLSTIFADVLHLKRVGVDDNFFELGGHSLLATRLISKIREQFQTEMPLRSLFEQPTVASLSKSVEAAIQAGCGLQSPPIVGVSHEKPLPLSFAQQRLWFINQLEPDNPFYNIPTALRLKGHLDIAALERALSEIIRRHEVLRTSFTLDGDQPVQVISTASDFRLKVADLGSLAAEECEVEARRLAEAEAHAPFDLSRGPLFRASLLRLSEDEHIGLFTMHHIVSDGWSTSLLISELETLYQAFSNGRPSPLPEPTIQYADFAVWQRTWLTGETLDKQLDYWRSRLDTTMPALKMPTDRPASALRSHRGATHTSRLPDTLAADLKTLSHREGCTLFMTLLAAFKTLLYRYSAQEDIVVGTPIANRNRAEIEGLIGFFVNTLVLRTSLSGNPTFRDALRRVRETTLGAYAHQDAPFELLVEELQPHRGLSQTPLFQALFAMQNAPRQTLSLGSVQLSELSAGETSAKFPLSLILMEDEHGLLSGWTYSTDLFDEATIRQMQRRYETLLQSIVTHPEARLSALEMFTVEEKAEQARREQEFLESSYKKLLGVKPRLVSG
ncbi:MAG TPA: amino acid adenylation domain-containing protein [Pyrinomonadaceae bacterium]|nr:amino acid adenylation domain-containing protein [Pyrinomonadaceae bacterium]